MPFKELLGSGELYDIKILPAIRPHLNDLKQRNSKKYFQDVIRLLKIKPEIDEDIIAISDKLVNRLGAEFEIEKIEEIPGQGLVNYKELTSYGCLREDVNAAYKNCLREGIVHYGPGITKEMVLLFLFWDLSCVRYKEICDEIIGSFTLDEIIKKNEGEDHIFKNIAKKQGLGHIVFDKYAYLICDSAKWYRSYGAEWQDIVKPWGEILKVKFNREGCDESIGKYYLHALFSFDAYSLKGKQLINRLDKAMVGMRRINWLVLCAYIYSIRCVEEIRSLKILKRDSELRKIWGIPRTTYRDKMNFISSVDK